MKLAPLQGFALALVLSACGSGGSDSPDSPANRSSVAASSSFNSASAAADSSSSSAAEPVLRRYEAEDAALDSGLTVITDVAGYSGTGYVSGFVDEGSNNPPKNATWSVNAAPSFYKITIGLYSPDDKGFNLSIDGLVTSGMASGKPEFQEVSVGRVWLDGNHNISIGGGWGWYHVDYLELAPLAELPKPAPLSAALVNPNATPEAKQLFTYLLSQYGKATLSGQQDVDGIHYVADKTGVLPAIYSFDLLNYSPLAVTASGNLPADQTEAFISRINNDGHVGTLMWHWHSPMHAKNTLNPCPAGQASCWWNSFYTEHSNFNLGQALAEPNSAEYQALISDIDAIAVQLKKVQSAGIPVLWRPLHEADGGWFWWGASGAESFKTLWRLMYERLTAHHQLNNLIWVWTNELADWYPGDDVVDIVSIDAYPSDKRDLLTAIWDEMFEHFDGKKPIALTEFGGVPFIAEMQAAGVWWLYFASWTDQYEKFGPQKMTDAELREIYNSEEVITLDELSLP